MDFVDKKKGRGRGAGTHLGIIQRKNSFAGGLWPMLAKPEKASFSPVEERKSAGV